MTYNGQTLAPTRAGSYRVLATITDANYQGAATNTLTITKQRQHAGVAIMSQAIGVAQAPTAGMVISWPPIQATVVLYESTDLVNWSVRTSANGLDGEITLGQQLGAHYFRAVAKASDGAMNLPLGIHRQ